MSYWRVFRRPICLTYRCLVFYVECEAFAGRNESFPTSFLEVSTTRLLFPRLRRKLLFSGFLSFVVKYSLHIRVIMSAVCVPADRTYSCSNTFSITTGRDSWNARFNFSPVQLERQQTKNNQKYKPTNVCRTFLEREAMWFFNYLRCNCTFKCLGNHRFICSLWPGFEVAFMFQRKTLRKWSIEIERFIEQRCS